MAAVVPMHVLQKYMGRQDISTTAKFYLGVTNDVADRARSAVTLTARPCGNLVGINAKPCPGAGLFRPKTALVLS